MSAPRCDTPETADRPSSPLTFMERTVCDCVAQGWEYEKIARECQISPVTARNHVHNIAGKLPPVDGVKAYHRVFLWLQWSKWVERREHEPPPSAHAA